MRTTKFQAGHYYHIYNRRVDQRDIFMDDKDYLRLLYSIRELNNNLLHSQRIYVRNKIKVKLIRELSSEASELSSLINKDYHTFINNVPKLVEIITYSLLPNHFHMLIKQIKEKGIEKFMHKLGKSYTDYFNLKYKRSGALFQGTYKAVYIDSDEYLRYLSAYINGNPEIHGIEKAHKWAWSSYNDYLGLRSGTICNKNIILKDFRSVQEYRDYVNIVISESSKRKDELNDYFLE